MVAWSHQTLQFCEKFLLFLEKRPLTVKCSKFCSESFHGDINQRCCVGYQYHLLNGKTKTKILLNLSDGTEIGEIVRYLVDTKILPASQTVATAWIAPKIFQGQPPTMYSECSRFHPNWFTFGGVIAERVNTAKSPHKVNPIFGQSLASSQIIGWLVDWSLMALATQCRSYRAFKVKLYWKY